MMKFDNRLNVTRLDNCVVAIVLFALVSSVSSGSGRTIPGGPFVYIGKDVVPIIVVMTLLMITWFTDKMDNKRRVIIGLVVCSIVAYWCISIQESLWFWNNRFARGDFCRW